MDLPSTNPFSRGNWHGRLISVDGTPAHDFKEGDLDEVLATGSTDATDWDGDVAGACRLTDGRFIAFETNWGPTGDGFSEDAYGGDADIFFGATLESVMWNGLSAEGRRLCGWPETRPE